MDTYTYTYNHINAHNTSTRTRTFTYATGRSNRGEMPRANTPTLEKHCRLRCADLKEGRRKQGACTE